MAQCILCRPGCQRMMGEHRCRIVFGFKQTKSAPMEEPTTRNSRFSYTPRPKHVVGKRKSAGQLRLADVTEQPAAQELVQGRQTDVWGQIGDGAQVLESQCVFEHGPGGQKRKGRGA